MTVSRWFVMPMALMRFEWIPLLNCTSIIQATCAERISTGSCSTQPGCGYFMVSGRCATAMRRPNSSKRIARTLVVPASSAMMQPSEAGVPLGPAGLTAELTTLSMMVAMSVS